MINVQENFKIDLRTYGRQFNIKLKVNNSDFNADNLNYIKPSFTTPLFKTIMHQIELDSKVFMPKDTKISGRIGVKVNEKNYKYIDLNNYYVQSCERQEDTNSYRVLAYSKMKEAMVDYDLSFAGKITVRNYLIKICERLGWNTDNIPATFINSEKMIDPNLHTGIKYSFRDALDEIATITCSFLMFKGDNFYLLYLTETNETIDESYLDEDNVTIGEKYLINSLVFSRAEESDNIYRKDNTSITANGLHEYKIADCQLLSTNDRADYIDEMFNYLKTLEFYIFDVQSKGILFLEACDLFNFKLNNTTYKVALLNDEINIDDGLTENLFLEKPEETETEYKYADSTDKKINQAYILVDKQNQRITQLTEETTENSQKITQQEQDIDSLKSKVSNIQDLTRTIVNNRTVTLENCAKGDLLSLRIKGNNTVFKYLYPSGDLYPVDDLFPIGDSRISVNETVYELGITDVLRQNGEVYDEFVLENGQAKVIRRINDDGSIKTTDELYFSDDLYMGDTLYLKGNKEEEIEDLGELKITLNEGTNTIKILNYSAEITAKYVIKSDYVDVFATKVEMNSSIEQTAEKIESNVSKTYQTLEDAKTQYSNIKQTTDEITTEVGKKVGENEIISKINQTAEDLTIDANRININGTVSANGNFKVDTNGNMECVNAKINVQGGENTGSSSGLNLKVTNPNDNYNYSGLAPDFLIVRNGKYNYVNSEINNSGTSMQLMNSLGNYITMRVKSGSALTSWNTSDSFTQVSSAGITTPTLTQTSKAESKKNFEKFTLEEAKEILNNTDIYKYNLKTQDDKGKKHIGFVIGDDYNYSEEITSEKNDGANIYSMTSVLYTVVKEQQKQIEELHKEINELKGEK